MKSMISEEACETMTSTTLPASPADSFFFFFFFGWGGKEEEASYLHRLL